jgi:hypothetical protein
MQELKLNRLIHASVGQGYLQQQLKLHQQGRETTLQRLGSAIGFGGWIFEVRERQVKGTSGETNDGSVPRHGSDGGDDVQEEVPLTLRFPID